MQFTYTHPDGSTETRSYVSVGDMRESVGTVHECRSAIPVGDLVDDGFGNPVRGGACARAAFYLGYEQQAAQGEVK